MTTAPRRTLQHWTIQLEDDWFLTFFDRGDAVLELEGRIAAKHGRASYEAFIALANAQMDKYVDEYSCKVTGGHDYDERDGWKLCRKCQHGEASS